MTSLTRRSVARLAGLAAVLFVAVGLCVVVEASAAVPFRDSPSLGAASISDLRTPAVPTDGITPAAPARIGDSAPKGPNRGRWVSTLLASLALLATWSAMQGTRAREPQAAPANSTSWTSRGLGRAPPVAAIS